MNRPKIFVPFLTHPSDMTLQEAVEERKVFYRLGDSVIFDYANKNTLINGQQMVDIIPKMVVENQGFIHVRYDQLDKTVQYELFEGPHYKISCKRTIKELIVTSIPYIIQGPGARARIIVNVSDFLQMDQYGKFQVIQARNYNGLMAILFAAAVSLRVSQTSGPVPADIADGMVLIYGSLMERCINSIVHMDPISKDKVRYLSSEFCLIQMYGTTTGSKMFQDRFKVKYFPKLSKMISDMIDSQFDMNSFDNLTLFIIGLKELYPNLKGITEYLILDKWIRVFGASTVMAIDYVGYLIYVICMVLFESPLITRMALEPVMEKNKGTEMYKRMQQIIG